jgi:outer membrane lipoprotein SlyB
MLEHWCARLLFDQGTKMKHKLAVLTFTAASAMLTIGGQAHAAGCMKGAAVGGVGGHFVGQGHAVAGAAGGCLVGHHMAKKKAKEDAAAKAQAPAAQQPAPAK